MEKIPQIHPKTGISQDYFNEYVVIIMLFNNNKIDQVVKIIKDSHIKTYEQRFPPSKYIHDYDEKIKKKVEALDEFAKIINRDFSSEENFNRERFKEIVNEVCRIIYGEERKIFQ
ncbi:MAG: hypothetical protein KatS3mg002_0691 [Candidatus Woesearchaeota archaeon]|nr:MAG: hypothetical protein KatS3mg002_0691 [Candidatus Woesearchaeota archaeon]